MNNNTSKLNSKNTSAIGAGASASPINTTTSSANTTTSSANTTTQQTRRGLMNYMSDPFGLKDNERERKERQIANQMRINSAKKAYKNRRRLMNRTRKNQAIYKSDIDWAIKTILYALETKELNLADLQRNLIYGDPDAARKSKKALKSLQYVLKKIFSDRNFFMNIMSNVNTNVKTTLESMILGTASAGSSGTTITLIVLVGASFEPMTGLVLLTTSVVLAFLSKNAKKIHIQKSLIDILNVITKILDDEKKVPIEERVYLMSNQNIATKGSFTMVQNPIFSQNTRKNRNKNLNTNLNKNLNTNSKRISTIRKEFSPTKRNFYTK